MARGDFGTIERKKRPDGTLLPGFYVRFRVGKRRLRRYGGPTKAIAEDKRHKAHKLHAQGRPLHEILAVFNGSGEGDGGLTFRQAVPPYLASAERKSKPSAYRDRKARLDYVLDKAPFADWLLGEIEPPHVTAFLNGLEDGGAAAATCNRYRSAISCVYRWAMRNGHANTNPVRAAERWSERGNAREYYLTTEQADTLIAAAPADFRDFLTLAVFTACRRGELLTLAWRDVDLEGAELRLRAENTKTSRARTVPLAARPLAVLKRRHRQRVRVDGSDLVLGRRTGKPLPAITVRRRWEATLKAAKKLPERLRDNLRVHDLRHCLPTWLVSEGTSLTVVARLLGHATTAVTERYAHLAPDVKRQAVDALDRALGAKPKKKAAQG